MTQRIRWGPVIDRAAAIVDGYETGVTLRQLFYRLVSDGTLPNTKYHYQRLSRLSAEGRRDGTFPDLIDPTRRVRQPQTWDSPADAREWLHESYRRDRTEGQETAVYLGVEKHGMAEQLMQWFGYPLGIPVLTLGGWSSQSFVQTVRDRIDADDRPAVFLYAGDFDPSGWFIPADFLRRVARFDEATRVATFPEQVNAYGLTEHYAPESARSDARAAAFADLFGSVRQVELDAFDADDLKDLYAEALGPYFDADAFREVENDEETERAELDPSTGGNDD